METKDHTFFEAIKHLKKDDNFNFSKISFFYYYQEEIEKIEKEYLPINEQIESYKAK